MRSAGSAGLKGVDKLIEKEKLKIEKFDGQLDNCGQSIVKWSSKLLEEVDEKKKLELKETIQDVKAQQSKTEILKAESQLRIAQWEHNEAEEKRLREYIAALERKQAGGGVRESYKVPPNELERIEASVYGVIDDSKVVIGVAFFHRSQTGNYCFSQYRRLQNWYQSLFAKS